MPELDQAVVFASFGEPPPDQPVEALDPSVVYESYGLHPPAEGAMASVVPIASETVKQPTKTPTNKVFAVGMGGGFAGTVVAWLKARFNLDITVEDVALFLPLISFAAGYFMKDRVPAWMQEQVSQWLR